MTLREQLEKVREEKARLEEVEASLITEMQKEWPKRGTIPVYALEKDLRYLGECLGLENEALEHFTHLSREIFLKIEVTVDGNLTVLRVC